MAGIELRIHWRDDWDINISGTHAEFFSEEAYPDGEPDTCEYVYVEDQYGNTWGSLGCIDDATDEYRREIEQEVLDESRWMIERMAQKAESEWLVRTLA